MPLIKCWECSASVSDQAASCPQCGAPARAVAGTAAPGPASASTSPVPEGRHCPFCGHRVPGAATLCGHCGAFHGYSDNGAPGQPGKLLGWALALLLLTALCWSVARSAFFKDLQPLPGLVGLISALWALSLLWRAGAAFLRGKRWWRKF